MLGALHSTVASSLFFFQFLFYFQVANEQQPIRGPIPRRYFQIVDYLHERAFSIVFCFFRMGKHRAGDPIERVSQTIPSELCGYEIAPCM